MTKAAEARWQGNTQEIKVGMLIATPADYREVYVGDDGMPNFKRK